MAFSALIIMPEPLQDVFVEEGLPLAFAFFAIADLGINLEDEFLEAALQSLILLAFLSILLVLVIMVHRSIQQNIRVLQSIDPATLVSPRSQVGSP